MSTDQKFCQKCRAEVSSSFNACPYDGGLLLGATEDPLVGTIFADKFEILSVLGCGGMATVYKARHQMMNRMVAIKLLKDALLVDAIAVERFKRESQAVSSLNHPNVVSVFDFGISKNQAYLVMDYLNGPTLNRVVEQEGCVSGYRAVPIFMQICDALEHAHSKNIVHRDLKPANICLVTQEGKPDFVKIVDFGLAKITGEAAARALTRPGQVFGSPLYISPEQCQAKELDCRADIYSMGCLMFETLTGMPPFLGETAFDTMNKHCNEAPPAMASVATDINVPKELESIVRKSLEKDPKQRFQTARELFEALDAIPERRPTKALPSRPMPVHQQQSRAKPVMAIVAVVCLVVIALAVTVLALSHGH